MPSRKAISTSIQRIKHAPKLPPRPADGHKGLFGRVLIVGGHDSMIGAPVLAGNAALRMGSGLVQVGMPAEVLAIGLSIVPELIGLGLSSKKTSDAELRDAANSADALAIGPGLGQSSAAGRRVDLLGKMSKPLVVDADGLNHLAKKGSWQLKADAVLTPHPGEMKRLIAPLGIKEVPGDDADRISLAIFASREFKQVLVLKGHRTVVTDGRSVYVNDTGDSSLSKAGAGDVLTGMIVSLMGQGMSPLEAACAGVHLHGLAGEIAGKMLGRRCVLARDVINAIPQTIAELE